MYHDYIEKHLVTLTLKSIKNISSFTYYYQNKARLYLDKYSEQKELRRNWFLKNPNLRRN